MIAVDTNVLIYAHRSDSPFHAKARACLRPLVEGTAAWAIPWPCLHEFVAIVTHPRIYSPPTPLERALAQLDALLGSPSLVLLSETPGYWGTFRDVAQTSRVTGPRIHDARVAAICLQHGVSEIWTADRNFSRFPTLKTRNPLLG